MKILLFANTDWYLYNFRLPLARALRDQGHQVVLLSPAGRHSNLLEKAGFAWQAFQLQRKGTNPFVELLTISRLVRTYRALKPGVVHHFTIKPVLYGSIAARLAGIPHTINAITGLGHIFTDAHPALRNLAVLLYRISLGNSQVIFQNKVDMGTFQQLKLIRPEQTHLIPGSGVDLRTFQSIPLPPTSPPLVILPARLLKAKGVLEFVEAARLLKGRARFALVGEPDPGNPDSVSAEELSGWQSSGVVEAWGWRDDMPRVIAQASIVCLPSYYGEGLSRTLLEAAACGRPIITTDSPGCRELVRDGKNGRLVPVRDALSLARAIAELLAIPEQWSEMGAYGRAWVEQNFSQERVLEQTLAVYAKLWIS